MFGYPALEVTLVSEPFIEWRSVQSTHEVYHTHLGVTAGHIDARGDLAPHHPLPRDQGVRQPRAAGRRRERPRHGGYEEKAACLEMAEPIHDDEKWLI